MPLLGTNNLIRRRRSGVDPALVLDLGTPYTDVAATIPANVGDAVAAWRSAVATPILVTQPTLTARPTADALGLTFDGGDWLEAPDQAALRQRAGFTVAAWWYYSGVGNNYVLVAKDTTLSGGREWQLRHRNTVRAALFVFDATGTAFIVESATIAGAGWRFVVGTIDIDRTPRMYVNGVLTATGPTPSTLAQTNAPLQVGRDGGSSIIPANNRIARVRIWHRALSAAEIAALWAAERGIYGV